MKALNLSVLLIFISLWSVVGYASEAFESDAASRLWRLAAQEQAMLEASGVIMHDANLSDYLQGVAGRLWKQVSTDLAPPTVRIVKDTRIEAYAFPNGHCFLSTGMLEVSENESQLAMILAHEMVHYARQHAAALYNHFQQTDPPFNRRDLYRTTMAGKLAIQQKIDTAEHQADSEGLSILKAAGYREAEVLPLISNLIDHMKEKAHSGTVHQLEQRAAFFRTQVGQGHGPQPDTSSSGVDPDDYRDCIASALMANAQISIRLGDWAQADKSISRFLASKPENARAYYLKGEMLRRQNGSGHNNPCIGSYEKALKIDPMFPMAHRALGELHYKAGRFQMAKPYFEAFLSLAPQDNTREFIEGYLRQCQN